mgnify:CR=1 FL=1
MTEFLKILSDYQGSRLLVLGHNEADSDALGAAYVLAQVFGGALAVPQAISEHARELQYKLKMKVVFQPDLINYDLIILVDCADPQQLPGCMPKEYLLIDHHSENKLAAGALSTSLEGMPCFGRKTGCQSRPGPGGRDNGRYPVSCRRGQFHSC